jgi:hypothetical protein
MEFCRSALKCKCKAGLGGALSPFKAGVYFLKDRRADYNEKPSFF